MNALVTELVLPLALIGAQPAILPLIDQRLSGCSHWIEADQCTGIPGRPS